jgi:membrane-associated phospholipid phosphatase
VKAFLKNNFWVLFIYLIVLGTALFFVFNYEKTAIHIYINQCVGNSFFNAFFYYITYLGDGTVAVFMLLLILLYNVRLGISTTFSFLTATLFATFLKYFFFDDVNRPYFIFQWIKHYDLKYVEGVQLNIHNSFPSGHATQAFAVFMCLVFASKNQSVKLLFLLLALLTSFSRVYLSQHWLIDVTVGSMIGMAFAMLFEYLVIYRNKFEKLNKSVFAFKTR